MTITEKNERNVVHLAALWQQQKVLKSLLVEIAGNSDALYLVNALDRYGNSPLHLAAQKENEEIVQLLLDNGAALYSKNEDGESPTIIASKHNHHRIVRKFLKQENSKVLNDEDEESNTALHVAAEAGHLKVVQLLCDYGADKLNRNVDFQAPLDLAAMNGHYAVVQYFLDEDMSPEPADKDDKLRVSPLQLACRNGHKKVVALLLKNGADPTKKDSDDESCLSNAIENGHRGVVEELLTSKHWQESLTVAQKEDCGSPQPRMAILRQLITKIPDMASIALDKCITAESKTGRGVSCLKINLEALDDTFVDTKEKTSSIFEEIEEGELESDLNLPAPGAKPYTDNKYDIKENHILSLMVQSEEAYMFDHPAVLALIREKWKIGRSFYLSFLLYYALFLTFVTIYMVESTPPYLIPPTRNETCPAEFAKSDVLVAMQALIIVLAVIGILVEIIQYFSITWIYLSDPVNLVDWFCYSSALIFVADYNECGHREAWQWQLGAFTVLGVWLNFLLFLRRFPALGIYVVMMTEILKTFSKIFIIFFLFIIAFGLSFHMLLQNQAPYEQPFDSIMKTWVQMLGELEFTGIFFDDSAPPPYESVTYAIFIIFLVLLAIILSNLLIGLAVDDVNQLRVNARRVKLAMQIDLSLDVEMALPTTLRRWFKCNKRRIRVQIDEKQSTWQHIKSVVAAWMEGSSLNKHTIVKSYERSQTEKVPTLKAVQEAITRRIRDNQRDISSMKSQLNRIEQMLDNIQRSVISKESKTPKKTKPEPTKKINESEA